MILLPFPLSWAPCLESRYYHLHRLAGQGLGQTAHAPSPTWAGLGLCRARLLLPPSCAGPKLDRARRLPLHTWAGPGLCLAHSPPTLPRARLQNTSPWQGCLPCMVLPLRLIYDYDAIHIKVHMPIESVGQKQKERGRESWASWQKRKRHTHPITRPKLLGHYPRLAL